MADPLMRRVPVVGALGYVEHVRSLPETFTATLVAEPGNRYFRHAIAVMVNGGKAGYIAPEIASDLYDGIQGATQPVACPGRRGSQSDHETSGVELLLDLSSLQWPSP